MTCGRRWVFVPPAGNLRSPRNPLAIHRGFLARCCASKAPVCAEVGTKRPEASLPPLRFASGWRLWKRSDAAEGARAGRCVSPVRFGLGSRDGRSRGWFCRGFLAHEGPDDLGGGLGRGQAEGLEPGQVVGREADVDDLGALHGVPHYQGCSTPASSLSQPFGVRVWGVKKTSWGNTFNATTEMAHTGLNSF
jgi:hypothetical protein